MKFSACGVGDVSHTKNGHTMELTIVNNGRVYNANPKFRVDGSTWNDIFRFVKETLRSTPKTISYEDDEGDMIAFSSDVEWDEAIEVAVRNGHRMCLSVETVEQQEEDDLQLPLTLEHVQELNFTAEDETEEKDESSYHGNNSDNGVSDHVPPPWFMEYMDKFRTELAEEISQSVLEKLRGFGMDEGPVDKPKQWHHMESGYKHATHSAPQGSGARQCRPIHDRFGASSNCSTLDKPFGFYNHRSSSYALPKLGQTSLSKTSRTLAGSAVDALRRCRKAQANSGRRFCDASSTSDRERLDTNEMQEFGLTDDHYFRGSKRNMQRTLDEMKHLPKPDELSKMKEDLEINKIMLEDVQKQFLNRMLTFMSSSPRLIKAPMNAEFLYDETVPDAAKILPGAVFVKTWRIANTGTQKWDSDTKLKYLWGSNEFVPNETMVPVSPLNPNQIGSVSVTYRAPQRLGHYESHWNFVHLDHLFGHRVWCTIEVVEPPFKHGDCSVGPSKHHETSNKTPVRSGEDTSSLDVQLKSTLRVDNSVVDLEPESGENQSITHASSNVNGDEHDFEELECSTNALSDSTKGTDKSEKISNADSEDDSDFDLSPRASITESDLASVLSLSDTENANDFILVPMPSCFTIPVDPNHGQATALDSRPAIVKGNAYSTSSSVVFIASDGEESTRGTDSNNSESPIKSNQEPQVADLYRETVTEFEDRLNTFCESSDETHENGFVEKPAECAPSQPSRLDDIRAVPERFSAETGEATAAIQGRVPEQQAKSNKQCSEEAQRNSSGRDGSQTKSECEGNTGNARGSQPFIPSPEPNRQRQRDPRDKEDDLDRMVQVLPEGLVFAAASVFNSAKSAITALQNVAEYAAGGIREPNTPPQDIHQQYQNQDTTPPPVIDDNGESWNMAFSYRHPIPMPYRQDERSQPQHGSFWSSNERHTQQQSPPFAAVPPVFASTNPFDPHWRRPTAQDETSTPAPPPSAPDHVLVRDFCKTVNEMGFAISVEQIEPFLTKHNGDVNKVFDELLTVYVDNDWAQHRH